MLRGDPDLADILFAAEMKLSQGVKVKVTDDETIEALPDFQPQTLKRDASTLYNKFITLSALTPSFWKIAGSLPESWKEADNRKWALWDLMRAKRRTRSLDSEDAVALLPGLRITEPTTGDRDNSATPSVANKGEPLPVGTPKKGQDRSLIEGPPEQTVRFRESDIKILFAAAKALRKPEYSALKADYEAFDSKGGYLYRLHKDDELITHRIKNLHFDMDIVLSDIDGTNDPHILLSFLNIFYGAAHASAWNSHFPTLLERWMWRISCFVLLLPAIVTTIKLITQKMPNKWHVDYYMSKAVQILLHPVLLVYFSARIYVVVESFISLRNLPEGSYDTVDLSLYWPHF